MSALIAEGKYPERPGLFIDNSSSNQHLRTVAARWISYPDYQRLTFIAAQRSAHVWQRLNGHFSCDIHFGTVISVTLRCDCAHMPEKLLAKRHNSRTGSGNKTAVPQFIPRGGSRDQHQDAPSCGFAPGKRKTFYWECTLWNEI